LASLLLKVVLADLVLVVRPLGQAGLVLDLHRDLILGCLSDLLELGALCVIDPTRHLVHRVRLFHGFAVLRECVVETLNVDKHDKVEGHGLDLRLADAINSEQLLRDHVQRDGWDDERGQDAEHQV